MDCSPGREMFLACSFWLIDAYVMLGRVDEAKALFERLIRLCNDVGLMSEQYDVEAKRLVGNFPQASHTSHWVISAWNLDRARVNCPAHLNAPRPLLIPRTNVTTFQVAKPQPQRLSSHRTALRTTLKMMQVASGK